MRRGMTCRGVRWGSAVNLSPDTIRKLTCPPGKRDCLVFDGQQRGLAVRVTATGSKTFLAQYTAIGQRRRVPLGSCDAIALADARRATQAIMGEVAQGRDPSAERKETAAKARAAADRERLTFAALIDSWHALHLFRKRDRYAREAVRALRSALPRHLGEPAEALSRAGVVRALDAMARQGHTAMASRTAAYGRACYQWAIKRGSIVANPFSALPAMEPRPKRERVLSDNELGAVWRAAETMGSPFGTIVRILILTGQRREEAAGLAWSELSSDLFIWTIASERAKNGHAHIVPLALPARKILSSLPRAGNVAMPGDSGGPFNGWSKAKARLDIAAGITGWALHDLRRTLATGLQKLGVRLEVTEAVLNHISGSRAGIVGIYQRHDWANEKRAALDAWAAHVMGIVEKRPAVENVVALSRP
jgi:integrase